MIVKAVDRITRIFNGIGDSKDGLTNAEIAKTLDLPKSTLSKILNSFTKYGWLALDAVSKRYRPGAINLFLAGKYIEKLDLVRLGLKFLGRLKEETGERACMEIPNGDEVVMVAKVAADEALVLNPHSIAGPVRDLYGRAIATLAVVTPDFRFDDLKKPRIEDSVPPAAADFSKLLGFQER